MFTLPLVLVGALEADAAEAGFAEVFEDHAAGAREVDAAAGENAAAGAGGVFDEFMAALGEGLSEAVSVLEGLGIAAGEKEQDAGGEFVFGEDGFLD